MSTGIVAIPRLRGLRRAVHAGAMPINARSSWIYRGASCLLLSSAGFLALACLQTGGCTEMGCLDQAAIGVHEADWSYAPQVFAIVVDGKTVTCTTEAEGDGECDDPDVSVRINQLADCVETRTKDAITQTCTPNGKFEHGLFFRGTPERVTVTAMRPDGTRKEREFEFVYETFRPNGPECEPVCKSASAEWTL